MTAVPELQRLARSCSDDPEQALVRVLLLLCEQLDLSTAVLGTQSGGTYAIRLGVRAGAGRDRGLEGSAPSDQTWCGHVAGRSPLVVADVSLEPQLAALDITTRLDIRCYAGTVVRGASGAEVGVLGVLGHAVGHRLDDRDVLVLLGLAEVVGELYEAFLTAAPVVPRPRDPAGPPDALGPRDPVGLGSVADALSRAQDVEGLTRPLLEALQELSGIASTYLTVVHDAAGVQEIRYANNSRDGFAVPEGLEVPWADTLCKRALAEGRTCTTDVPAVWPEVQAAADMGILTYVSVPVRLSDGRVWGTLCAADDVSHPDAAGHVPTLSLFARLISAEVERAATVARARALASRAQHEADTDELTGCSSRRTVTPWLNAALAARSEDEVVLVAFVDVDHFKQVNDRFGHATGDTVLTMLGTRLLGSSRPGDLVARLGGDEFVVAARLPRAAALSLESRVRAAGRFVIVTPGGEVAIRCATGVATSNDAVDAAGLLSRSDADMYREKALSRVGVGEPA